jgi:D-glycero-beta-D-manno-heptose-7-phosphate kinase
MTKHPFFDRLNKMKVIIVGDVMIDAYFWGRVERISPEAPVPIVSVDRKENRPGGAANVAANIHTLGAKPYLCSVIGDDVKGELFKNLLKSADLETLGLISQAGRRTSVKTRVMGNNHQMIRVDQEDEISVSQEISEKLINRIEQLIQAENIDILIFEDYDKGVITPDSISSIIHICQKYGVPVSVDPKKRNFMHYSGVQLFKPNLKELREGLKIDYDIDLDRMGSVINVLHEKYNIETVLLTLSERGVFVSDKAGSELIPAHIRNVADVSGAGDTVISVASLAYACQLDKITMATLANLAGGLVCESVGVVPVTKQKLMEESAILQLF